jgi:pyroglutamyl-peptidase
MMYLTGFGPFGQVEVNPSSRNLDGSIEGVDVRRDIEVTTDGVDLTLKQIPLDSVVIHFGVNAKGSKFQVEKCAYNAKSWAEGEKVEETGPNMVCTDIDVHRLVGVLESEFPVEISTDPGRYVCNYMYYRSLRIDSRKRLFVHVPPYEAVAREEQLGFIKRLVEVVRVYWGAGLY